MFTGLAELVGQVPLVWLTHFSVIKTQNMQQILSKFWKGQTNAFLRSYGTWCHVVGMVGSLAAGVLALVLVMAIGHVDLVMPFMVEGMHVACHLQPVD